MGGAEWVRLRNVRIVGSDMVCGIVHSDECVATECCDGRGGAKPAALVLLDDVGPMHPDKNARHIIG